MDGNIGVLALNDCYDISRSSMVIDPGLDELLYADPDLDEVNTTKFNITHTLESKLEYRRVLRTRDNSPSTLDLFYYSEYSSSVVDDCIFAFRTIAERYDLPIEKVRATIEAMAAQKAEDAARLAPPLPNSQRERRQEHDFNLSPPQVIAVIDESTLGRLPRRYKKMLLSVNLPADGFETKEQARAAGQLSSTYQNLRKHQIKLGLEPSPKHPLVTEAERLRTAFYRTQRKQADTPALRDLGKPANPQQVPT